MDFDFRYRAQVAFVIGILTGWFALVQPYRSWLIHQEATELSVRYAGNFLPPILGGCIALLVWLFMYVTLKKSEQDQMRRYEGLMMSCCAGLICGTLLIAPRGYGYFIGLLQGAIMGGGIFFFGSFLPPKYRRYLGIFVLMVTLGAITGWLILDYQVGQWVRGNFKVIEESKATRFSFLNNALADLYRSFFLDDTGQRVYDFKARKEILTWLPSYIGVGFFVLLYPIALVIDRYARQLSIKSYGLVFTMVGIGYWYIPMGMTGVVNQSFLSYPPVLRNQFRIACLFTHKSRSWPTAHYEVQFEDEGKWIEGPLEPFFPIDIFGHRTRFNRIILASKSTSKKTKKVTGKNKIRLQEMGEYIRDRWQVFYPDSPKPLRIRFTIANHPVNPQFFTQPSKKEAIRKSHCMAMEDWSRPALVDINKKYQRELGVFELKE